MLSELVADSGDRLLRVAYQLTHDRGAAQDLLVEIAVGCYPEVGNLYLDSHSASTVMPVIQQLLKAE